MKNIQKATTAIILEKRIVNSEGKHPVKLRLTFQRKQKYYVLDRDLAYSPEVYDKIMASNPRGELKEAKILLSGIEEKAREVIKGMEEFTFEAFEDIFFRKKTYENNVFIYFDEYIEKLTTENRFSSAESYKSAKKSFEDFVQKRKLSFEKINSDFLKNYEKWMAQLGKSYTTSGIYMRNLRTLFNLAISDGTIEQSIYPFTAKKYKIPVSKNIKKALNLNEIERIYNHESIKGSPEERGKDMWILSYLCNGMNVADIAYLKFKNIQDNKIYFFRKKTILTSKEKKQISVVITPEIQQIINRWRTPIISPENYIFPIIHLKMTPLDELRAIKQCTRDINKYMNRIVQKLRIDKHITTYYARHSFSTILKQSGVSTEFISESLGHHDLKTTENYLDSFEDETKIENAKLLTNFKK